MKTSRFIGYSLPGYILCSLPVTGIYFVSVAIGGTYTAIYRINRVIGG